MSAQTDRAPAAQEALAHPLEPMTAEELSAASEILRAAGHLTERDRVVSAELREPAKELVLAYQPGDAIDRQLSFVILAADGQTYEATVSVTDQRVVRHEHVPGVQAAISLLEFDECEAACKANPEYREALAKRGITDVDSVIVDSWSFGSYGDEDASRRLVRALTWARLDGPDDNAYAHPVDNLAVIFDLGAMEIVRIEDGGVIPVPRTPGNYAREFVTETREDIKPLEVVQPEGATFTVEGHAVSWLGWNLRVGFTPKEGLVLHQVAFEQDGEQRPILYRASISEMVTPYGDPAPCQWRKNAFDSGEYQAGATVNSLELGCDCLGEIAYLDVVLSDETGQPAVVKNGICIHEEDVGLLWKHTDPRTMKAEVRRARRLVVSFITTVSNYEYAFYWYFYQDGTIEHEVKASGIVQTAAHGPGGSSRYGQTLNEDGLYAPIHQHLFNVRLDMSVDGMENSVYEVDTLATELGSENPKGNAFYAQQTLLARESDARRNVDVARARHWKVVNNGRLNKVGQPVGYRLVPKSPVWPLAHETASVSQRAGYGRHDLWVTRYAQEERHAAGDYPNQHAGGDGLPKWVQQDRALEDADVVLWHSFGLNHVVRLEDWPVMPVQHAGFKLEPMGFFDENPTLDVPPSAGGASHCTTA